MAKKILLVDDEEDFLEALGDILNSEGYDVMTAKSGAEGMVLAKDENPDLLILDIAMPGMDGIETLERLRGVPETATTPVLMLTAKGSTGNIMAAERFRAAEFLIKPFEQDELVSAIRRVIR